MLVWNPIHYRSTDHDQGATIDLHASFFFFPHLSICVCMWSTRSIQTCTLHPHSTIAMASYDNEEDDDSKPFPWVGIAKTNRSKCAVSKEPILQGSLRIGLWAYRSEATCNHHWVPLWMLCIVALALRRLYIYMVFARLENYHLTHPFAFIYLIGIPQRPNDGRRLVPS